MFLVLVLTLSPVFARSIALNSSIVDEGIIVLVKVFPAVIYLAPVT